MTRDQIIERLTIEWRSQLLIGAHVAVRQHRPELAALLDALIDTDAAVMSRAVDILGRLVDTATAADLACTCPCRGECTT